MDTWNIAKNILTAFLAIGAIISAIGGIYVSGYLISIILGTLFNLTTTGDLPVGNNTTNFLGELEASYFTTFGYALNGVEFAAALIVIAVVLIVFAGALFIGYKKIKGSKGSGMGW